MSYSRIEFDIDFVEDGRVEIRGLSKDTVGVALKPGERIVGSIKLEYGLEVEKRPSIGSAVQDS